MTAAETAAPASSAEPVPAAALVSFVADPEIVPTAALPVAAPAIAAVTADPHVIARQSALVVVAAIAGLQPLPPLELSDGSCE